MKQRNILVLRHELRQRLNLDIGLLGHYINTDCGECYLLFGVSLCHR